MRIAAAVALLLAAALPAAAQDGRPVLKRDVVVAGEVVMLGDLLDNAGKAAAIPAFRAPPLGKAGTIQASRVVEAARAAGVSVEAGSLSQVVVSRASRRVTRAEIEVVVRRALADRYAVDNADVALALEGNEQVVHVEREAEGPLKVSDLVYDTRSRRIEAVLSLPGSRSLTLQPMRVAGQVVETVEVPVLLRAVARGETLGDADVRVERRPRAEFQTLGFADAAALSGRVTRAALAAGAVLRDADLMRQDLVEKNGTVTVVYEMPGLALSMRGKALEAGGLGDVVSVQNIQSRKTIQATVTAPGVVSVTPAQQGRVAQSRSSAVTR